MTRLLDVLVCVPAGDRDQTVLDGVSLEIRDTGMHAICGPSGSGKSTLLAVLAGILIPRAGEVCVLGENLLRMSDSERSAFRLRRLGFVFQSYGLVSALTAVGNVMLPLEIQGVPRTQARERAAESLRQLGMNPRLGAYPDSLSGGERQRVAIARSLVTEPDLILADEPTGALDREATERVIEILLEAARSRGVVVVTHDDRVARAAGQITQLMDGRIEEAH